MHRNTLRRWMLAGLMMIWIAALAVPALAEEKVIVGVVNDSYQIVCDSQIYEIDNTEKGEDLADNHEIGRAHV